MAGPTRVRRTDTRSLVTAALFAALISASAFIAVPLPGGVPFTLQLFVALLTGLVLTPGWAGAALGVYLLLGVAGVPVFAGGKAGIAAIVGPTGGYLIGFAVAAMTVAAMRQVLGRRFVPLTVADVVAVSLGLVVIYAIGWTQLALVTGMSAGQAFMAGVVPFVVLDVAKAAGAVFTAAAMRRAGVGA